MDELHAAAQAASQALATHWRRGFIERAHGQIARQRSTRMFREYTDQLFLDIEDVVRAAPVINLEVRI
jgi:hypothetical protein